VAAGDDIRDRAIRQATQQRLQQAVEDRLAVLRAAAAVLRAAAAIEVGEIRRVGWAHVAGIGVPQDPA
jgi:hypothetical protein